MGKFKDLTDEEFDRLTVIKRIDNSPPTKSNPYGNVRYLCRCDCGNEVSVFASNLQRGTTTSCGCFQKLRASQANCKDLTGKPFGKLTALCKDEKLSKARGRIYWKCECSCEEGNIISVSTSHLNSGHTQSCGCYRSQRASEANFKSLVGEPFGRLTVLERVYPKNGVKWVVYYKCQCSCGNTTVVRTGNLLSGDTQSCGCLHIESISGENNHNWNGGDVEFECEYCGKVNIRSRGLYNNGATHRFCNHECHDKWRSENVRGDKLYNYKYGLHSLAIQIRQSLPYREWRIKIFQRDRYICLKCGSTVSNTFNAHHKKPFYIILEENNITTIEEAFRCEELWDIDTGVTLCRNCHIGGKISFHGIYGTKDFTEQNYHDWIKAAPMLEAI